MVPIIDRIFDRFLAKKDEYLQMQDAIKNRSAIIFLVGPRGTGKTSIIKKIVRGHPGTVISLGRYADRRNFRREYFLDELKEGLSSPRFSDTHSALNERLHGAGLAPLFDAVDSWGRKRGRQFVLAIDDAQYLRKFQHLDFRNHLAYIADNCKNISMILAGRSEGQIRNVCGFDDPKAPIFGRAYDVVQLQEMDSREKERLWTRCMKDVKPKKVGRLFGQYMELPGSFDMLIPFIEQASDPKAGRDIVSAARQRLADDGRAELERFLRNRNAREKYMQIMHFLSGGASNWKRIKDHLEIGMGQRLYDRQFDELLKSLREREIIKKEDGLYRISNPMLALDLNLDTGRGL